MNRLLMKRLLERQVQLARDFCAALLSPVWISCFDTADFFFVVGNRGRAFYHEMHDWVENHCHGGELDSVVDDEGWMLLCRKYGVDTQQQIDYSRLEGECREYIRKLCSGT